MKIRRTTPEDARAIRAIWNPLIATSVTTFNSTEKSLQEVQDALNTTPFFVAETAKIIGFASYYQFRGGIGYRHSAEYTINLAPEARGQGAGRALLNAVEAHAREAGFHTLVAGISAENSAGLAFHSATGFTQVGKMPQVGRKFDRWMDLVLMQKIL